MLPVGAAAGAELDDPEEHAATRLPVPASAPVAASPRRNCRRPSALPDSSLSDGSTDLLLGLARAIAPPTPKASAHRGTTNSPGITKLRPPRGASLRTRGTIILPQNRREQACSARESGAAGHALACGSSDYRKLALAACAR